MAMNSIAFPAPFSRISGFTFYPPRNRPKDPDDINNLLYVNGPGSGYKPYLIQGDLSDNFLSSMSCSRCKGILNQPVTYQNRKACQSCFSFTVNVPVDVSLSNTILTFTAYCPLYKRGCSWTGTINSITNHFELECDFVYQKCAYVDMGLCLKDELLMRRELLQHYTSTHAAIQRLFDEVDTLKVELVEKVQENRMLMLENRYLKQTYRNGNIIIQLTDIDERIGETICSPIFQTNTPPNVEATHGYNMQVVLTLDSDKSLSAAVTVKEGHSDDVLPWPMLVNYSATVFSYLCDERNATYSLSCCQIPQECRDKGAEQACGWAPLTTHDDMYNRVLLKDKTLYLMFQISFI